MACGCTILCYFEFIPHWNCNSNEGKNELVFELTAWSISSNFDLFYISAKSFPNVIKHMDVISNSSCFLMNTAVRE